MLSHVRKNGSAEQESNIHSCLTNIMGVDEASKLWGLAPGYIKNLCNKGSLKAVKIGKTWILDKNQPNPKQKDAD